MDIKVPVKAYLRRFIHFKTGTPLTDPVDLSLHDPTIYLLEVMLHGKRKLDLLSHQEIPKAYDDFLAVTIPERKYVRNRFFLNESAVVKFNSFLFKLFLDDLLWFVVAKMSHDVDIKDAIGSWMNLLEIEDLYDYEALIKAFQRMCQRKNIDTKYLTKMSKAVQPL